MKRTLERIRRNALSPLAGRLARSRSGNATLLLALGMPMLVGGAGLGVDTAQWYLWKRELQFAVDQAAIAGAWAKAADQGNTTYVTRALQEYHANAALVAGFDIEPSVTLANYDGGTSNSVLVTGSATRALPFSSLLTGSSVTVAVRAQAIYEPGATYRPCLTALSRTDANAVLFNGNVDIYAPCGISSLSNHANSVTKLGNSGSVTVNFIVTAGNISDAHGHFSAKDRVINSGDLYDPYEGLTPPNNPTQRSLSCPSTNKFTADESVQIRADYAYFKGRNTKSLTTFNHPNPKATTVSSSVTSGKTFNNSPANSQTVGSPSYTQVSGGGNDTIWERQILTTTTVYTNIVAPNSGPATAQPGTYTDFTFQCDTVLAGGVYVLNGATFTTSGQHRISGTGVMIVLRGGSSIKISGGSAIDLTAMNESQLIAAGVATADVERMLGMLIFEDPNSPGGQDNTLTGTTTQILNGIIYLPKSNLKLSGTPRGTSACVVVASKTLEISGNANLSTLCPVNVSPRGAISDTTNLVRLVG